MDFPALEKTRLADIYENVLLFGRSTILSPSLRAVHYFLLRMAVFGPVSTT